MEDKLIEQIREILCRQCDGISHADTCGLNKNDCPVLKTAPNQFLNLQLEKLCPECRGSREIPMGSSSVDLGYQQCRACKGTGKQVKTVKDILEGWIYGNA